jgi:hypothetical protein
MSLQPKGKSKARDPPPSLFLHPSPAGSHVSLPGIAGVQQQPSVAVTAPTAPPSTGTSLMGGTAPLTKTTSLDPSSRRVPAQPGTFRSPLAIQQPLGVNAPLQRGESSRATDRTDALWAEMQATLEEVELSASGGTRVFGPDHDRKLGELRAAQIALAQAWARSEADEAIETTGAEIGKMHSRETGADATSKAGDGTDAGARSTAGTGSVRPGSSGPGAEKERLGQKLEEETEVDILLARKRREANDRYFQRVNQGVLDVVAKLEDVAVAMRAVEQESKDIWAENESVPASEKT